MHGFTYIFGFHYIAYIVVVAVVVLNCYFAILVQMQIKLTLVAQSKFYLYYN